MSMPTGSINYPRPPIVSMPLRQRLEGFRQYHRGAEMFRDAVGPVATVRVAPAWMMAPTVWVSSPQGAHDVLGARRGAVDKVAPTHVQARKVLGPNLFDLDDRAWLPRRRAIQPVFTKQGVRNYAGEMSGAAMTEITKWGTAAEVDLDHVSRMITIDALARSVLGAGLDEPDEVGREVRTLITMVADRSTRPLNPPYWLPTPANRRAHAAAERLRGRARAIVQRCRDHPDTGACLVHALLDARDPATGRPLDDDTIVDELVIFIGAGHETTATTLAYALWQLGRHQDFQDRVRQEASGIGGGVPTPDDLGALSYTTQVVHEALRLFPPAPALARMVTQDLVVDGFQVSAGHIAIVGVYALQRDTDLWPDPLTFDPDRFEPTAMKSIDRWSYLPFGAGRRSCIGDHFAMLEAVLALATIIREVHVESRSEEFPMALPFTAVAAEPVIAEVTARPDRGRAGATAVRG
ncbi:cytochrome P450 [Gordonia sp. NPDC127522]|uniref:cytochrome P450 n=1 Tax=Gordonia sp. NPDC127522 TaxID=3345390 RepID=UPI00362EFB56